LTKRLTWLACGIVAVLSLSHGAQAQDRASYEKLVAIHAKANAVPEALVHRVIVRESKYHPDLVGRGGTIGLMQIKLATARGAGYTGDAEGLRDPDINLAYGVKYLAGAWRAADGDHDRAMRYYASGYYHVAKQRRLERLGRAGPVLASAPPQEAAKPNEPAAKPKQAVGKPLQLLQKLADIANPKSAAAKPKQAATKPKQASSKQLADAKPQVPRPPAAVSAGAKPGTAR
jgi:hypothetical protein